ncbi:hypothetical protein AGMMS50212_04800 [Spirochaetia bacterium]|nr:hypothetical protein AGMMS50212_04800 [Spirochaetia bacterium]
MDDYEENLDDELFSEDETVVEDNVEDADIIDGAEPLPLNSTVYQLRLQYSHEPFYAAYTDDTLKRGNSVLVTTRYGKDLAQIICKMSELPDVSRITRIERAAAEDDLRRAFENKDKEKAAFDICKEKILDHKLDMKLITVHYLLEETKILFFFTSENRVDFRELVKDLVSVFKTRIELRQVGIRDEARIVGGLAVCGRPFCCHTISDKIKPVSIKMAKDQNLSLNSMKISGPCGRLLCCLSYEHSFYAEQRHLVPPEGTRIFWDGINWKVIEINIVVGMVRLSGDDGRQIQIPKVKFEKKENQWIINENNNSGGMEK